MTEHAMQIIKPREFAKVGNRAVSVSGFHIDLVKTHLEAHLLNNPRQKWCTVNCLARTMFGRDTEANRRRIRERIGKTFRTLLSKYGVFMVIEYDTTRIGRGKILACKLYESRDGAEIQCAAEQLDRMFKRGQITNQLLARANEIIGVRQEELGL